DSPSPARSTPVPQGSVMEKVVFVAHQPGDTPSLSPADVEQLNQRLLGALPAERYLGISLQLEDRATTDRWQRRTEPVARRFAATLSVWVEAGEDTADAAALVDDVWPDHVTGVVTGGRRQMERPPAGQRHPAAAGPHRDRAALPAAVADPRPARAALDRRAPADVPAHPPGAELRA
ncbi:hypothetical protein, partial [Candidatus Frankia nodulisporulans]|uniref:hypothetical protein n=1 Tax=Candidatus Frankia nodulisporulans TaxID=2060052 RepID=UPI003704AB60